MTDQEYSPEKFIDREDERLLFHQLLKFQDDARLLTICDAGARGKSTLLKHLRYECGWHHEPSKLAGLVLLNEFSDYSRFDFVTQLKKDLTDFAGEYSLKLRFPKFDRLDRARSNSDFAPFRTLLDPDAPDPDAPTRADAGSAEGWNQYKEDTARRECVDAFLEDLRKISNTQPLIVLLDAWEHAEAELREWIVHRIVRPFCFNTEVRPETFVLVLAGRELPDFKHRMGDEGRFKKLVKSIPVLGLWEERHVRDFLKANGYEDLSQEEDSVSYIHARLKDGWSLLAVQELAKAMRAGKKAMRSG